MKPEIQALLDLVNQLGPLVDASHEAADNVQATANAITQAQAANAAAVAVSVTAKSALEAKVAELEAAAEALKA